MPPVAAVNAVVELMKPGGVVSVTGKIVGQRGQFRIIHEERLLADVGAPEPQPGTVRQKEVAVTEFDEPRFTGGNRVGLRKIKRGSGLHFAGVVDHMPCFVGMQHNGLLFRERNVVGRNRGGDDDPDGVAGASEREGANRFVFEAEFRKIESDPRTAVPPRPDRSGVCPRQRIPEIADVHAGAEHNALFRTVFIYGDDFPERRSLRFLPGGGVKQIEIAHRFIPGSRQREFGGKARTIFGTEEQTGTSRIILRFDHVAADAGEIEPAAMHFSKIVRRPLIGPAAFAVVGDRIGKSHVRRGAEIKRGAPPRLEPDRERQLRGGHIAGIRIGQQPQRPVVEFEFAFILKAESESAAQNEHSRFQWNFQRRLLPGVKDRPLFRVELGIEPDRATVDG